MKKLVIMALAGAFIISCSDKKTEDTISTTMLEEPTQQAEAPSPNDLDGKSLIEGMDCATCHKENEKMIGPSYQEIANKYTEGDMDMLADKIINGGSGNWGDVPMTPHAGLPKENAKKMVAYIMSLKK